MKLALRLALLVVLPLSSCTVLPEQSTENAGSTESPAETPAVGRATEADLRRLLLLREDLGDGWFSQVAGDAGGDTGDDAFDRKLAECGGSVDFLLEVEGGDFVNGSTSVGSTATLYKSTEDARSDMDFIDDPVGRDCLRAALTAGLAEEVENPADVPPFDVQIEGLQVPGLPTSLVRPARAWLITIVADIDGPVVLGDSVIMAVQIDDVVVSVTATASNVDAAEPSEESIADVYAALGLVAQRAQTWTPA